MEKSYHFLIISLIFFVGTIFFIDSTYSATPFFANDALTQNGIEWCQENRMLYEILGLEEWLKHHNYSIEARVCAHLYNDPLWSYTGSDRIERLIERSRELVQAEIQESVRESKTGQIDIKPAELGDTVLYGTTPDGFITIKLVTSDPVKGKPLILGLTFQKKVGFDEFDFAKDVNYDIHISQNNTNVLSKTNQYEREGSIEYTTSPLPSNGPVDIDIKVLGIGKEMPFTEPKNAAVSFHVIPEFETIFLILGIVLGITVITTRFNKFNYHITK